MTHFQHQLIQLVPDFPLSTVTEKSVFVRAWGGIPITDASFRPRRRRLITRLHVKTYRCSPCSSSGTEPRLVQFGIHTPSSRATQRLKEAPTRVGRE